ANGSGQHPKTTKFLALDKCLPHRDFMQIVEIPHDPNASNHLEYDPEWIAVLKATNSLINVSANSWNMPENNGLHAKWDYSVSEEDIREVLEEANHDLQVPHNFSATVACYDGNMSQQNTEPIHRINPQTTEFCARFGLTDINDKIQQLKEDILEHKDDDDDEEEDVDSIGSTEEPSDYSTDTSALSSSVNPDEIILDEDSADEDPETPLDPSHEYSSSISAAFSDVRILPDSMTVSPNDTADSVDAELEKSNEKNQLEEQSLSENLLKRTGGEKEEGKSGPKRIKRRNQAIYASKDEDEVE
ncbi:lariat debranching enzyme-like, partial [Sceloporus undulatus]|uniref:lariat debranching enzyme-like n=1 Tax=Sceloporus undulatus TaxID=8520 RepID=UPI001C4AAE56